MKREEILSCYNDGDFCGESVSIDSVTNIINTLRKVGCEINRPSKKTDYCYVLKSHPFSSLFTEENINALQELRESITTLGDWELLINLNKLYKKLAKYACDDESKDALIYNHKLKNINLNLLKELNARTLSKKKTMLIYNSPIMGKENLEFFPQNIALENDKMYLCGYSTKHKDAVNLRIDRIKGISFNRNILDEQKQNSEQNTLPITEVTYRLTNLSALMYLENDEEEIIEESKDSDYSIVVRAKVINKFTFFQKILSYGTDCQILEPMAIIRDFKKELAKIKAVYSNGK